MKVARLCYVDMPWAWFTSAGINQWGDDWNDAPYEHNAGDPYLVEGEVLYKVAFEGPFWPPCEYTQHYYSVQEINSFAVPWLEPYGAPHGTQPIFSGTTYRLFVEAIIRAGGRIYEELEGGG